MTSEELARILERYTRWLDFKYNAIDSNVYTIADAEVFIKEQMSTLYQDYREIFQDMVNFLEQ